MKDLKLIRRKLFLVPLALIVLAAALIFMLPWLFQLPVVQNKTSAFLSKQFDGRIFFDRQELTLFPRPCIHLYNVRIEKPGKYSAVLHRVAAVPNLFSCLRGRLDISQATLDGADFTANIATQRLPAAPAFTLEALGQSQGEQEPSIVLSSMLDDLGKRLGMWMNMLGAVSRKKIDLEVENGRLDLTRADKPLLSVQNIGGGLHRQGAVISLRISSSSDLSSQSDLSLRMNLKSREISGRLSAKNLTPRTLWDAYLPDLPLRLEDAILDADLSLETRDLKTWRLSLQATTPAVTFRKKEELFHLQGKKASGEILVDKTGIHAVISELDLESPSLHLTGGFDLDTETPLAAWQASIENSDIESVRLAALFFADRFKTTRHLARSLLEGSVPRLVMGQEARTLKAFKDVTTFHLQGALNDGVIYVPKADLLLGESFGEVTVSDGILAASNIRTRLGNSTGSQGKFNLTLFRKKPRDWSVAFNVQADLPQLPPLLGRLTKNAVLAEEMAGITSVEGFAKGLMKLERGADPLQVSVDVSAFDLSAVYHRIPFPVTVSGGEFTYRNGSVRIQDIQGDIGNSLFDGLAAGISWDQAPHLNITSARADIDANEAVSWLGSTFEAYRGTGDAVPAAGRIFIEHLQLDGPACNPTAWQFQSDGLVKDTFSVSPPLFPETLTISRGRFTATHEKIDFLDSELSALGTRLFANISLKGFFHGTHRELDALILGELGEEVSRWITDHADIPKAFRWCVPMNMVPVTLHWQENESLEIWGDLVSENGIRFSIDLNKKDHEFSSGRLDIQSNDKRAATTLTRTEDGLRVRFTGELSDAVISELLVESPLPAGSFSGDFSARLNFTAPYLESMTGHLQIEGLDLAPADLPLKIEHLSLTGTGAATRIETARFIWNENEFTSSGEATRTEGRIKLNLALACKDLDWQSVCNLKDKTIGPKSSFATFLFGDIHFTCDSLNLTPALHFEPFEAQLALDGSKTDITFQQADACGISFPGTISISQDEVFFSFTPSATKQPLGKTATCLQGGTVLMDGLFDFDSDIAFQWDRDVSILKSLEGSASLTAKDGRIYRAVLLGKLFSLLNISEILSGQFPDLEKEGFPYETSTFSGKFKDGIFELETGVISGPAMKIFFEGTEDLLKREHKLTLVVAPLRTVDKLVDKIPVINDVLEKGLVIYPVRVTGDWQDPQLTLLSPTAVGSEVMGFMIRTLKIPVTIFEKLFSGSDDQ